MLVIARRNPDTVTAEDDEGNQPLSRCRDGKSVKLLVDFGADVDHQNHDGRTALHISAADPTLAEVTKELLDRNADANITDEEGCTPLHVAARWENEQAIDLLLAGDADVSAADNEGNTPLLVALDKQFRNIAEKLVDSGAEVTGSNKGGLVRWSTLQRSTFPYWVLFLVDSIASFLQERI